MIIVIDALRNLDIKVCPNDIPFNVFVSGNLKFKVDDCYNQYLNSDIINKSNALVFSSEPTIRYNDVDKSFVQKEKSKKTLFINSDKNILESDIIHKIIHELIHSIKSQKRSDNIVIDKLVNRNGLLQTFYKLKYESGIVYISPISESGRGLNEAITEIDTLNIYRTFTGEEYTSNKYKLEMYVVKQLYKDDRIKQIISEAEIDGNIPKLRSEFDNLTRENAYDELIVLLDNIIKSNYAKNEDIYNNCRISIEDYLESLKTKVKKYEE